MTESHNTIQFILSINAEEEWNWNGPSPAKKPKN